MCSVIVSSRAKTAAVDQWDTTLETRSSLQFVWDSFDCVGKTKPSNRVVWKAGRNLLCADWAVEAQRPPQTAPVVKVKVFFLSAFTHILHCRNVFGGAVTYSTLLWYIFKMSFLPFYWSLFIAVSGETCYRGVAVAPSDVVFCWHLPVRSSTLFLSFLFPLSSVRHHSTNLDFKGKNSTILFMLFESARVLWHWRHLSTLCCSP